MAAVPPATPDIRFLNILYGCEYIDINGFLQYWKGLIVTDSPIYNLAGGLVYKKPIYVIAGSTVGFTPGTNTATMDGTNGTDDWRGWTPIITRAGVMRPGVDYSWDPLTGILTLLLAGDKFGPSENFFVQFEFRTGAVPVPGLTTNQSAIANFVYYQYRKGNVTQYTGIGEVNTNAENAGNVSPRSKGIRVWNELHYWVDEFLAFMRSDENSATPVYPEWNYESRRIAAKYFAFQNPIF
jgi:hypothetical protein